MDQEESVTDIKEKEDYADWESSDAILSGESENQSQRSERDERK